MASHQQHHYVPASYFRPWCNQSGLLTYFRWHGSKFVVDTTSPKVVTKELLLYALHGAPEHLVVEMETQFFSPHIDDPGAAIIQALWQAGPGALSVDQRHLWTRFVMALHTRRPEAIEYARETGRQIVLDSLCNDQDYKRLRAQGMPDSLVDFVAPWVIEDFGMLTMPAIVNHEPTHEMIMSMRWWCLDFKASDFDLLTSDRPLIWPLPADDPNFYLFLRLGPRLCFFAAKKEATELAIWNTPPARLVRQINESVIMQCEQCAYAAHAGHAVFVERRLRPGQTSAT